MPKLKTLDAFDVLILLKTVAGDQWIASFGEDTPVKEDEYMVILPLKSGNLDTLEFMLEKNMPLTPRIRAVLLDMIKGTGEHSDYLLVTKKNPKYPKNSLPFTKKYLNQIARLRVGFAIEAFGGFEAGLHESAITQACETFNISRSFAEKVWSEYRNFDHDNRHKFRIAWDQMCQQYDGINFLSYLGGKK